MNTERILLEIDIFGVNPENLPKLYAYEFEQMDENHKMIGWQLAYRLRKHRNFLGNWIYCNKKIITDEEMKENEIKEFLKELRNIEKEGSSLLKVQEIKPIASTWEASALKLGEFAARYLLAKKRKEIEEELRTKETKIDKIQIVREYAVRGYVVNNEPAVSITISSSILSTETLDKHAKKLSNEELIGEMVAVEGENFKGTIVKIIGKVTEKRQWLLDIAKKDKTKKRIEKAPDDELIFEIKTRQGKPYIYIASMLRPIIRMDDIEKFVKEENLKEFYEKLRFRLEDRYNLVTKIAELGQKLEILKERYNSDSSSKVLYKYIIKPVFLLGGGKKIPLNEKQSPYEIYKSLKKYGLNKRSNNFSDDNSRPIKIRIINALLQDENFVLTLREFLKKLKKELKDLYFPIESVEVNGKKQQKIDEFSRKEFENAVKQLNADILLALFPGKAYSKKKLDNENIDIYDFFKTITMEKGLPSQVIYQDTLSKDYAMANIVLGILAKTGNIPFVLANPLPYADIVVGIDVARKIKEKLSGTINAIATVRIYLNDGQFLRYTSSDEPIEGETIPEKILKKLFYREIFKSKKSCNSS